MSCRKITVLISALALLAVLCDAVPAPVSKEAENQQEVAVEPKEQAATAEVTADDQNPAASAYYGHGYGNGFLNGYGNWYGNGYGNWYGNGLGYYNQPLKYGYGLGYGYGHGYGHDSATYWGGYPYYGYPYGYGIGVSHGHHGGYGYWNK